MIATETRAPNLDRSAWPVIETTLAMHREAQEIRARRANAGGIIYTTADGIKMNAKRWLGELGPIAIEQWLRECGVLDADWIRRKHRYSADFTLGEDHAQVRVRTTQRASPTPDYFVGLNERHAKHPRETNYLVACFNPRNLRLVIVGGIQLGELWDLSTFRKDGEEIEVEHATLKMGYGGGLRDVTIAQLVPPKVWLCDIVPGLPVCFAQQTLFGWEAPKVPALSERYDKTMLGPRRG